MGPAHRKLGVHVTMAGSASSGFGMLLTGIHKSSGSQQQQMGDTCLMFSLGSGVFLIDSHRHKPELPVGTPCARAADGEQEKRMGVMSDWLWRDGGFLSELNCDRSFVVATVFKVMGATDPALSHSGAWPKSVYSADITLGQLA